MYQLFKESPLQPGGGLIIPEFRRIQTGLRFSLEKVIEFHRENPVGLNGAHFLVKLLQSINVPLSMEPDIYDDKVRDIALNLAMSLKMTSPLSQGRVFTPGIFYGQHVTEVLIANIDPYDQRRLATDWRSLRPIRVLYHPKSDLNLDVPNGHYASEEAGMAVISINIPMLASQYRVWRNYRSDISDDSPRSIMQFLMELPLPNMLYSHLDIAIMNRIIGRFFDIDMKVIKDHHSFYLTDWSQELDQVLDKFIATIEHRKWDFDTIISQIPTVFAEDFHHVLRLPDMAFTQQVQWAVVIARLPLVTFLVQFNRLTGNPRNQMHLNYIRRYLRQMDLNRTMQIALPNDRYDDVMVLIDEGVRPFV